jgi:hypothetical protein
LFSFTKSHNKRPGVFNPTARRSAVFVLCVLVTVLVVVHGRAGSLSPHWSKLGAAVDHGSAPLGIGTPTLGTYADKSVTLAGNATINPSAPPTNATSASATTTADFKGELETDPVTGQVRITNANPAGVYLVTVTAFNGGGPTSTTFTLTVRTPAGCGAFPAGAFIAPDNLTTGSNPISVAVGDLNRDGKQDLVNANQTDGTNPTAGSVSVFLRNTNNTGFDSKVDFPVGHNPVSVAVGDFNGDGNEDIVTANQGANNVSVLLGNGAGALAAPLDFPVGTGPSVVAVGDFNSDGQFDIVTSNNFEVPGSVSVLLRNSNNTGFDRTDFTVGTDPYGVAVGDFNGDGKPDIVTANVGSSNVSVLLRNVTNSGFESHVEYDVVPGGSAFAVTAGDFDGDGKQDIGVTNAGASSVSVLINVANTSFAAHVDYSTAGGPRSIAIGDFNDDGKQDIATANFGGGNVSVLLGNATGFDSPVNFTTGSQAFTVAVGDFDSDNRQDLASSNRGADNISVLIRDCGGPTAADGAITGRILDVNGMPIGGVIVDLSGSETSQTITNSNGEYGFANAEADGFYTVTPQHVNYTFSPSNRSFSLLGAHTEASFTALANGGHLSPLGTPGYFVRQQYLDFLSREPDPAGLQFWTNNITSCGDNQNCAAAARINVSAAFFLSIEFQQTGYLTYRLYKAAYGNIPGTPVPMRFEEFLPDTQKIGNGVVVNQANWQQKLEANKQAFIGEFVQRSRFSTAFSSSMTAAQFVDKLNANAGGPLSPTTRDQFVNDLASGAKTRTQILRMIVDDPAFVHAESNRAFVLMQYFGYLRRNPNDAPEASLDFQGYDFWLAKLDFFNGNFADAEMVQAFLVSGEYRQRFGN